MAAAIVLLGENKGFLEFFEGYWRTADTGD
jgi:hypothetical protein